MAGLFRTIALAVGLVASSGQVGLPASDSVGTVHVMVVNQASVGSDVLADAQTEMSRLFALIDVRIVWTEVVPSSSTGRFLVVCLTGQPMFKIAVPTGALGFVAANGSERAHRAYVLYERVVAAVQRYPPKLSQVLAIAMAHEVGHMLEPITMHDAEGLMRAIWNSQDFHLAARGKLVFSKAAAARIRAGVDLRCP